MPINANAAPKQETVEVTLLKDGHTHKGKVCKKGDKITVTLQQRDFLVRKELVAAAAK